MADYGANLELIPVHMSADSDEEIELLMVLNNQLNQTKFNYMSAPQERSSGKIVVYFYADIKYWKNPAELTEKERELMQGYNR